jgi:succinate dehydrogenase / fumarate reductase flavoprotein subunit
VTHRGPAYIKAKLPSMYEQFRALADVDITRQPMEVAPTIHYAMGGIHVEPETGATTVEGLFAAGECAAGLHGANRLGGNSLSDLLVFGRRAGEAAAAFALSHGARPAIDEQQVEVEKQLLLRPFESAGRENPYLLHEELQEVMDRHAGIARTHAGLAEGLMRVGQLQQRLQELHVQGSRMFNPGWHTARDDAFMLTIAEALLRCALERTESRGAHWRTDFPDKDPVQGSQNYVVKKGADGMELSARPMPPMPRELALLLEEKR